MLDRGTLLRNKIDTETDNKMANVKVGAKSGRRARKKTKTKICDDERDVVMRKIKTMTNMTLQCEEKKT